jgi:hypothetical protein
MRVIDRDSFLEKASEIHGGKYDYSEVEYKGKSVKVRIVCKTHGAFCQTPEAHYSRGCPACSKDASNLAKRKDGLERFLERCKETHGDRYSYANVKYKSNKVKVEIICQIHGSFFANPIESCKWNWLSREIKRLKDVEIVGCCLMISSFLV